MPPETTDAARDDLDLDLEQEEERHEEERREEAAEQERNNSDLQQEEAPAHEELPAPPAGETIAQRLQGLSDRLNQSEKGGISLFGNSGKFDAVSRGIGAVLACLDKRMTDDRQENQDLFWDMVKNYAKLIDACDAYCASRNPWTTSGKNRRDIVKQVGQQAREDVAKLRASGDRISTLSPQDRTGTLLDALGRARQRTIQLRNKRESDLDHVGGAVSHIAVLNGEDIEDENVSGFFKEEDVFTLESDKAYDSATETEKKEIDRNLLDMMSRRIPLSPQTYESIKTALERGVDIFKLNKEPEFSTNLEYYKFVIQLVKAKQAQRETSNHVRSEGLLNAPLKKGEQFRVSDRNVATSRVANMLGIGDLVAQSETAILRDAGGTAERRGNLMQKARGTEARKLAKDRMREEFTRKYAENGNQAPESLTGLSDQVTPAFMKSITSLQVLDNLVGQVDRHSRNFMIDTDENGKLGKVQGIDNDFAFGNTTLEGNKMKRRIGSHGISILNNDGELNLPYMDSALADRILALRKPEVTLMLVDVLEDWAIEAFWERVKTAQDAIRRDKKKDRSGKRYLKEEASWNNQVLQEFRNNKYVDGKDSYHSSYLSRYLDLTEGIQGNSSEDSVAESLNIEMFVNERKDRAKRVWGKLCSLPGNMAVDYLCKYYSAMPEAKAAVLYLSRSGEMNGNLEVVDRPEYYELFSSLGKKNMEQEVDDLIKSVS